MVRTCDCDRDGEGFEEEWCVKEDNCLSKSKEDPSKAKEEHSDKREREGGPREDGPREKASKLGLLEPWSRFALSLYCQVPFLLHMMSKYCESWLNFLLPIVFMSHCCRLHLLLPILVMSQSIQCIDVCYLIDKFVWYVI